MNSNDGLKKNLQAVRQVRQTLFCEYESTQKQFNDLNRDMRALKKKIGEYDTTIELLERLEREASQ